MPPKKQITRIQRAQARRDETAVQFCEALCEGKDAAASKLLTRYRVLRQELMEEILYEA